MADVKKVCVLGRNPSRCRYKQACRYWVAGKCEYQATRELERRQRHDAMFDDFETTETVLRIDR